MKIVKWLLSFPAGTMLGLIGFAALGVPADLPVWRWIFGVGLLASAVIVLEQLGP